MNALPLLPKFREIPCVDGIPYLGGTDDRDPIPFSDCCNRIQNFLLKFKACWTQLHRNHCASLLTYGSIGICGAIPVMYVLTSTIKPQKEDYGKWTAFLIFIGYTFCMLSNLSATCCPHTLYFCTWLQPGTVFTRITPSEETPS